MYYQIYEWNHAIWGPARAVNDAVRLYYRNPLNPLTHTEFGRQIAAAGDLFERMTRRYGKPDFGITETEIDGARVAVSEKIVWERPFCKLLKFERELPEGTPQQPNIVLVAPMSGHYATLLRGTVEALLPHNNVYITDWTDARKVPLAAGRFNLDDFVDYIIDIIAFLQGDAHLVAVCQPAVPVFAATALLEHRQQEHQQSVFLPRSITLMGGPIDTRQNPTEVNTYATQHDIDWFRRNAVMVVPFPHPGVMRKVYPGFLQLTGFMTMNLDRHMSAHYDYFDDLVKGDGDSADKHRDFYDEYMSVMDLTAEFYLQTVEIVFLRHALPKGEMQHRGEPVDPSAITQTPIFTIEGEKDDISGIGQTRAAHTLTPNLPAERHHHYEQSGVGHYGVFNGSRFRNEIAPRICEFVRAYNDLPIADAAMPGAALAAPDLADVAKDAPAATESAVRDHAIAADTLNDLVDEGASATAVPETSVAPLAAYEAIEAAPAAPEPEAIAEPQAAVEVEAIAEPEAIPEPEAAVEVEAFAEPEANADMRNPAAGEPLSADAAELLPAAAEIDHLQGEAELAAAAPPTGAPEADDTSLPETPELAAATAPSPTLPEPTAADANSESAPAAAPKPDAPKATARKPASARGKRRPQSPRHPH